MPKRLRFGIPSFDRLFGGEATKRNDGQLPPLLASSLGLHIPGSETKRSQRSSVSLCLSGPDGTGKSILGLHLVSTYLADCFHCHNGKKLPKVLYISTDLKFGMAETMWRNFGLGWPGRRIVPFEPPDPTRNSQLKIKLRACFPLGKEVFDTREREKLPQPLAYYLSKGSSGEVGEVFFVDLASATAGDDWGYVNRVLSLLEAPRLGEPCHMLVIDSVEGFETLVGERDAFGETQPRRSRIAQVMRSAANKCHTLFIVEEPEEGKHLPEEFVTDVVIRLRSVLAKDYVRRTVEIEKARGHSHVRGQHAYLIRSGSGSTTGMQENHDDPRLPVVDWEEKKKLADGETDCQSYLHVCPSLHYLNRSVMLTTGKGRPASPNNKFAAFGIRHLDDMLESVPEKTQAGDVQPPNRNRGNDGRGLRCGTATTLIGNSETQKRPLGVAFLSRCFRQFAERYREEITDLEKRLKANEVEGNKVIEGILQQAEENHATRIKRPDKWPHPRNNVERRDVIYKRLKEVLVDKTDDNGRYADKSEVLKRRSLSKVDDLIKAAAWRLGAPQYPDDGIPVLFTTQDIHAQKLASEFLPWLVRKVPDLKRLDKVYPGCLAALRILMEEYTICRRLEIHDLPSAVFIHLIRQAVGTAQQILIEGPPPNTHRARQQRQSALERFNRSWGIRVVIDDFSIMKNTYIEIHDEPLLLRFLIFYLGREGVTTLLIDTQPGRPDTPVASALESEMRSLVDYQLYTWRFSFFGEARVAISPIPPISERHPTVVRELKQGRMLSPELDVTPLVVDPHFELYSGIEKGVPQPVPLQIRLFAETEHFQTYIEEENAYYQQLFTPVKEEPPSSLAQVIVGVPPGDYDKLRDMSYLQKDTRLEYTLIFQVDEFWFLRRQRVRRAGTFMSQWEYLNAIVAYRRDEKKKNWLRNWAHDPFGLFQLTEYKEVQESEGNESEKKEHVKRLQKIKDAKNWHRKREFATRGYSLELPSQKQSALGTSTTEMPELRERPEDAIDRVPFMWDFGFLLCKKWRWERCFKEPLPFLKSVTVKKVWDGLPKALKTTDSSSARQASKQRPSWREFLEACCVVARAESYRLGMAVPAFDIQAIAAQTFSCLVLEIWASEIYQRLKQEKKKAAEKLRKADRNSKKYQQLKRKRDESSVEFSRFITDISTRNWDMDAPRQGLIDWLEKYQKELFKTWLLLVEALDLRGMAQAVAGGGLTRKEAHPATVAVRHWYKTACKATEQMSLNDPFVPLGLPGNFTMRGDWFLAVAGGSRSRHLAERALDLLNSRRANQARLRLGLGLPVRHIYKTNGLHTALTALDQGGQLQDASHSGLLRKNHVRFENLLRLGGAEESQTQSAKRAPKPFYWLWRSGLHKYYRHAKIWQEWLNQTLVWWDRQRYLERDYWMNGFKRYDLITAGKAGGLRSEHNPEEDLEAWRIFKGRCASLLKELKEATDVAGAE